METEQDYAVVEAMETYGGPFVKALADACKHADPINFKKILETWPDYWKQYTDMADKRPSKLKK